jgi:hypothetical protein
VLGAGEQDGADDDQTGEQELYDLLRDPHELDNIATHPSAAPIADHLRQRLALLCRPRPPGYTALTTATPRG